jgi:hypothetical protein
MASAKAAKEGFEVSGWVDTLGGLISRHQRFWIRLGDLETRMIADDLSGIPVEAPIYVSGLARSGSTILLEALARHEHTATHRYKDYPPVFTPYFWNWFLERAQKREGPAVERSHKDGIAITPESPEAFEEVLWMAFFPALHDPGASAVLDRKTRHPEFEAFYRDHIRKLLRVRGAARYLAKANYNVTRLEYLLEIFPDARFVVPVRDPVWHVASLMKQHALFCVAGTADPRALAHLQRVGHFEFGLDRRPVNIGDADGIGEILNLWQGGAEVEGWARYWSQLYGYVADRLEANPRLRDATLLVGFEELCREPRKVLRTVLDHCRLPAADAFVDEQACRIRFPSYYRPAFSAEELALIERCTAPTAARFGYGDRPGSLAAETASLSPEITAAAPAEDAAAGSGRAASGRR